MIINTSISSRVLCSEDFTTKGFSTYHYIKGYLHIDDNRYLTSKPIEVKAGDVITYNLRGGRDTSNTYPVNGITLYDTGLTPYSYIRLAHLELALSGTCIIAQDGYVTFSNMTVHDPSVSISHNPAYEYYTPVRWLALGDSITEGYYSYLDSSGTPKYLCDRSKGWIFYVSKLNDYELTNRGVGGSGYVWDRGGEVLDAKSQVDDINDFSSYDLVTLAYGTNDWKASSPVTLGSIDDTTSDPTIINNLRYIIEKIQSSNPHCKIVLITPLKCLALLDDGETYSPDKQNNASVSYSLRELSEALISVCDYYGIEYIDMNKNSIINRLNITHLLLDKVHPSEECHKIIAREIAKRLHM